MICIVAVYSEAADGLIPALCKDCSPPPNFVNVLIVTNALQIHNSDDDDNDDDGCDKWLYLLL